MTAILEHAHETRLGIEEFERRLGKLKPGNDTVLPGHDGRFALRLGGDRGRGGDVSGRAEILSQRRPDGLPGQIGW